MATYSVWRYRSTNGKVLVTEWLRGLRDSVARIAIDRRILRMETGNFGDHRYCRDGIWEIRVDVGPGYRVYYAIAGTWIVVLLCGGDKRTQSADIARAAQYWEEWQWRIEHEGSVE